MEIKLNKADLEAICLEKCKDTPTPYRGYFVAEASRFSPEVTITFFPEAQPAIETPQPTKRTESTAVDDDIIPL